MGCGVALVAAIVPLSLVIALLIAINVFFLLKIKKMRAVRDMVTPVEVINEEPLLDKKDKKDTKNDDSDKSEWSMRSKNSKLLTLNKEPIKLLLSLENDCINTPSVHVVNALIDIRDNTSLSERHQQNLNVIIQLIATKQLYDYQASNFNKRKELDSETSKFLIEYTTNVKRSQAPSGDSETKESAVIGSIKQRKSKSDLRKAVDNFPPYFRGSSLMVPGSQQKIRSKPEIQKETTKKKRRYLLDSVVQPLNIDYFLLKKLDEEDDFFGMIEKEENSEEPNKDSAIVDKFLVTQRSTKLYDPIRTWNFDAGSFYDEAKGHGLYLMTFETLERLKLFEEFPINKVCLHRFIRIIEASYLDNSYHNAKHASDVIQAIFWIISNNRELFDCLLPIEKLALIIAAACHDVGHPGLNNAFLVNVEDNIAITYNDVSVLECMHASRMFELLHCEELDFLADLDLVVYRKFRQLAIDLILATDMSKHASIVSEVKTLIADKKMDFTQSTVRLTVMKTIIKMADISNSTRPWEVCQKWAHCVMNEFFYQGDMEKERDLTISAMMDRTVTKIPKSQVGFCQFVVLPLAQTITSVLPACHELVDNISANIEEWKKLEAKDQ